MTSRTTSTTAAVLCAAGVAALVGACAPARLPAEDDPVTSGARAAHDDPPTVRDGSVTLGPGDEVDLDGETVVLASQEVELAWDGERLTLPVGTALVEGTEPDTCDEVLAQSAGSTGGGVGEQAGASARAVPVALLGDGLEACLRTDAGVVVHVEVTAPDVRDDLHVRVLGQRAE
ncbi:hypothetical protein [Cellulosimicrobium marinum]|uniref:hypothetical protein n=1 Tax=Cellulosimicrobium marinum TaxID=1638992 RepID=UPI001E28BF41|nr:hypothetical protein [Cellulosimicrobium marinum]MCB7135224.1 hypothetical protein [Cellulosimicrobium marinum]